MMHGVSSSLARPAETQILALRIRRVAGRLAFLLHLRCDLLRAAQDTDNIPAGQEGQLVLVPSAADQFGKLRVSCDTL